MYDLAFQEKNEEILEDCEKKIEFLDVLIKKSETKCFLSGENDDYNIYLEIHAGAGGTESQDWAEMLRRMYLKWFDKKNFRYEIHSYGYSIILIRLSKQAKQFCWMDIQICLIEWSKFVL